MANELFTPAVAAFGQAAQTTLGGMEIEQRERAKNLEILQSTINNLAEAQRQKAQERSALGLQRLKGQQAIDLEREKQRYQNIEITPEIAKGLGPGFEDAAGQIWPIERVLGVQKIAMMQRIKPLKVKEGGKEVSYMWNPMEEKWQRMEAPRNIRETEFPPKDGADKTQKELKDLNAQINADYNSIESALRGGIPEEPGAIRKFFGAEMKPGEKVSISKVRASINRLRQNLAREQRLLRDAGDPLIDRSDILTALEEAEKALPGKGSAGAGKANVQDALKEFGLGG